jgi:hypothetical protein
MFLLLQFPVKNNNTDDWVYASIEKHHVCYKTLLGHRKLLCGVGMHQESSVYMLTNNNKLFLSVTLAVPSPTPLRLAGHDSNIIPVTLTV